MMFCFKAHYPVCNHGSISTEVLHNNTCSYMCMPFTYSRINRGIWTIECNLGVIGWSYSWQNAIWWSLIRLSRYPQSSLETFLAKSMSMISSNRRKLYQWGSLLGTKWPIASGRNLARVHIWAAKTNWFLVTWLTAYRVITEHVHGAP